MASATNTLMMLHHPPADTEWQVEQAHQIGHPKAINADDLWELRSRLQALADAVPVHARRQYPFGPLDYRYEADEDDMVTVVHAYFKGHNGLRRRFMKLRRTLCPK